MAIERSRTLERRTSRRVRVAQKLIGHAIQADLDVQLVDVGPRSFAVTSTSPFQLRSEEQFQFKASGDHEITFTGTVKRCERARVVGEQRFLVGLEFVWKTPSDRALVDAFIRALVGRTV